jgi:hypothetical protein
MAGSGPADLTRRRVGRENLGAVLATCLNGDRVKGTTGVAPLFNLHKLGLVHTPMDRRTLKRGNSMPHVMVTAEIANGQEQVVMLRERIGTSDLESDHFAAQLVERLAWAVSDVHEAEQGSPAEQR